MKRKIVVMIASLVILVMPERGMGQGWYTASRVVLYGGLAVDLGTTERAISRGAVEMNPALGQGRGQRMGVAIGGTVLVDLVTRGMRREHPRFARVLNFLVGSVHVGAGAWNWGQVR